jgi:hypothetical protein
MGNSEQRIDKLKLVKRAINIQLRKDIRQEAFVMCVLAPEDRLDELLELHKADNGNIFCLCLDSIKYNLWKCGIITKDKFPNFGEPFTDD